MKNRILSLILAGLALPAFAKDLPECTVTSYESSKYIFVAKVESSDGMVWYKQVNLRGALEKYEALVEGGICTRQSYAPRCSLTSYNYNPHIICYRVDDPENIWHNNCSLEQALEALRLLVSHGICRR